MMAVVAIARVNTGVNTFYVDQVGFAGYNVVAALTFGSVLQNVCVAATIG
jgi:hypothetical protein